ncbi:hypothetical protein LGK95_06070 [Clostridium algoriphilum]|uniref:anti-sigma-I factor RsgI family protein n=1 Tax=Clostridium algoriphilum TaxID=198347 RepID=UPI001CF49AFC|nr:hypothetical protein [Clostridium algoriphilum]MCB2293088.1 hypothetical protein [Clostridium algoriphilum]
MRKAGKVINIEEDKVYIITANNEFVTLEKHTAEPVIGELYAGEEYKKTVVWKYLLAVACIILMLFLVIQLYLDNRYNYSVIVDMNCSLKMDVNGSNKITKVEGISSGGYKMKQLVSLEHKSLDEALHLILDESIKQKYLTKAHADDGFELSIFVSGNKHKTPINLTEFNRYAGTHNFKVLLNNNGQAVIN